MEPGEKICFRVMIEGTHVTVRPRSWMQRLFRKRILWGCEGLYTTRWVWVHSAPEARMTAIALVETWVKELLPGSSWQFAVDEVWEDAQRSIEEGCGQGATWY